MSILNVNFDTRETAIASFERIAKKLSESCLKINNTYYRLVDFEFYAFAAAMPDPHTYKHDLQLQTGKLYLHGSGVDITCGDGKNYGGILLRSVIKLDDSGDAASGFMKQQYVGPQNVATELFSNLNSLLGTEKNEISLVDMTDHNQHPGFHPARKLVKTQRVGLTPKPNDPEDYYLNLPLRYITILPQFPAFKQALKGIEGILGEQVLNGNMSVAEAQAILGYQKKF